jgi:cysteinyl-tRNA synthetase
VVEDVEDRVTEPGTRRAGRDGPAAVLRLNGRPLPVVGRARVYSCGITPYDVTHLGHAATFVWVDVVTRVLRWLGTETELCRNVTDVDDVLLAAAERAGAPYDEFAAVQQFTFDRDMAALGVGRPAHQPRAHTYVAQVVNLAASLLASGEAYERGGSVYFRGLGRAGLPDLDQAQALRLAAEYGDNPDDPAKDHPLDVAVWRAAGDGPAWPSPWGPGRPGWHAECAAMALSIFGPAVDLLAGGEDLRFPHHAYQVALAEGATGVRPFPRAVLHVGTVRIGGQKMAKSAGNLVLLGDLLADHPPAVVRMLLLDRPWQAGWDYRPELLERAGDRLEALYSAAGRAGGTASRTGADPGRADRSDDGAGGALRAALCDDLDVPRAVDLALDGTGRSARTLLTLLGLQ